MRRQLWIKKALLQCCSRERLSVREPVVARNGQSRCSCQKTRPGVRSRRVSAVAVVLGEGFYTRTQLPPKAKGRPSLLIVLSTSVALTAVKFACCCPRPAVLIEVSLDPPPPAESCLPCRRTLQAMQQPRRLQWQSLSLPASRHCHSLLRSNQYRCM